jgi:hypothetical protein
VEIFSSSGEWFSARRAFPLFDHNLLLVRRNDRSD